MIDQMYDPGVREDFQEGCPLLAVGAVQNGHRSYYHTVTPFIPSVSLLLRGRGKLVPFDGKL